METFLFIILLYVFPAILSFTMWAAICKLGNFLEVQPLLLGLIISLLPGLNIGGLSAVIILSWQEILRD